MLSRSPRQFWNARLLNVLLFWRLQESRSPRQFWNARLLGIEKYIEIKPMVAVPVSFGMLAYCA